MNFSSTYLSFCPCSSEAYYIIIIIIHWAQTTTRRRIFVLYFCIRVIARNSSAIITPRASVLSPIVILSYAHIIKKWKPPRYYDINHIIVVGLTVRHRVRSVNDRKQIYQKWRCFTKEVKRRL